ncbi:MAG: hypothetical protein AB1806_03005 [Acidobacteriota bacterium]
MACYQEPICTEATHTNSRVRGSEFSSKKRREDEFRQLRDDEVASIEFIVVDAFDGFDDAPGELVTTPAED